MTVRLTATIAAVALAAGCAPLPDTVGEAAPEGRVWTLAEFDGQEAAFPASLQLLGDGRVRGAGPCNSFTARQRAPLPWVEFTDIQTAGRICPDKPAEDAFFLALGAMEFAEVAAGNLLLTDSTGQSLYFRATGSEP